MNKRSKPDISIILPGIRKEKWLELYQTIQPSCGNYTFELILVGPHEPEEELLKKENLIFIKDFGSPVRCQQIGIEKASGEYITWISDDGLLVPETLWEAIEYLNFINDEKSVCIFNYTENNALVSNEHLKLINAYPKAKFIHPEWFIFNVAVLKTSYLKYLGGYDCLFEATAVSHADLAARAQNDECRIRLFNKPLLKCGWTPGTTGDHRSYSFWTNRK